MYQYMLNPTKGEMLHLIISFFNSLAAYTYVYLYNIVLFIDCVIKCLWPRCKMYLWTAFCRIDQLHFFSFFKDFYFFTRIFFPFFPSFVIILRYLFKFDYGGKSTVHFKNFNKMRFGRFFENCLIYCASKSFTICMRVYDSHTNGNTANTSRL